MEKKCIIVLILILLKGNVLQVKQEANCEILKLFFCGVPMGY